MKEIGLSVFTNSAANSPSLYPLLVCLKSFEDTFEYIKPIIYVNDMPKKTKYQYYLHNIRRYLPECKIIETKGLADGFHKTIKERPEPYVFMLEHDWKFQNISHTLKEIIGVMKKDDLYYFGFNKNPNRLEIPKIKSTFMKEKQTNNIHYILTDSLSNYPHIIDREYYLKNLLKRIKLNSSGSQGIEERLTNKGLIGARYGPLNHPPTLIHLNGDKKICTKENLFP
jgi:hypothetical protein